MKNDGQTKEEKQLIPDEKALTTSTHTHTHTHLHTHTHIYIYILTEGDREEEGEKERGRPYMKEPAFNSSEINSMNLLGSTIFVLR